MSEPVNYKPSGYICPCRNCGGQAKPAKAGEVVTASDYCYEPIGADWAPWMCRHGQDSGKRPVKVGELG